LEAGTSDMRAKQFQPGQAVATFTIGTGGSWKIEAPGVAAVHAYGRFDGSRLLVATADPDQPVLLDGRPVPETWLAVAAPAVLAMGHARVAIESRVSSEFPAAAPAVKSRTEAATRIDIEPPWGDNQVERFEKAAHELTRTQFDQAPPAARDVGRTSEPGPAEARARRKPLMTVLLLVLGAGFTAAAYRFIGPGRTAPVAAVLEEMPSRAPSSATPVAPVERTAQVIEPSRPALPASTSVAPGASSNPGGRTVEREAVDALTAGDFAKASRLYRALTEAHPQNPAFKEALRILEQRSQPH